ncbi:MAG: HAD-IA family hydrolase [Planctomycetota bacterium]
MPQPRTPDPLILLVVFDLGRVLLRIVDDFDHACARADRPALSGFSGDLSVHARRNSDPEAADLFNGFETGTIAVDDYAARAAAITGASPEDIIAILDACLIETYPGTVEMLDRLADLPTKTACLSNTNARHWQLITDPANPSYLPLERLDYPWGSQILGLAKPNPAIYRRVEELTDTPPDRILFFDDISENIDAARACGWHAELVARDTDNPIPAVTAKLEAYGVLATAP